MPLQEAFKYYVLKDRVPVEVPDVLTWTHWLESVDERDRIVRQTRVGPYFISTAFLGLDHTINWHSSSGGPPIFETIIFDEEGVSDREPCSTWEEAERHHENMCRRCRIAGFHEEEVGG